MTNIATLRISLAAVCLVGAVGLPGQAADAPATELKIHDDPAGGKKAVATLRIAASPDAVRAVLSDYERWPDLFLAGGSASPSWNGWTGVW